jgi:hypothetical protein
MMHKPSLKSILVAVFLMVFLLLTSGCDLVPGYHMRDQAKFKPHRASTLFADGTSDRPIPANTVPRGEWYEITSNEALYTGIVDGALVEEIPIEVNREVLLRGQERFNIFCSPCHGRVGDGQGMIVQRGFKQPSSFHLERLRTERAGYFFNVITNGFGVMYSYGARVKPYDRWAIVAYIRALQYSQGAPVDSLSPEDLQALESAVEQ